jgi:ribonucleoside-diphosphate reductase beta chain
MVYSYALEGIFFYSGFAFFFNLARQGKMVGTQTMISYINRDELAHGKVSADILRAVLYENPDYNTEEFATKAYNILSESAELEIEWSKYALEGIDGIDLEEMADYVKYRANKIARNIGLSDIYEDCVKNPMPWIEAYADNFGGGSVKTDFF